FASGLLRKIAFEFVNLRAFAPDDNSGARGVDDYLQAVGRALNINVRDARSCKALLQILLELQIFQKVLAELAFGEPVRVPIFVVAQSEAVWMNFLTHSISPFRIASSV